MTTRSTPAGVSTALVDSGRRYVESASGKEGGGGGSDGGADVVVESLEELPRFLEPDGHGRFGTLFFSEGVTGTLDVPTAEHFRPQRQRAAQRRIQQRHRHF
mgnify:CR=1 FL=1